jgi:hypothetical protein
VFKKGAGFAKCIRITIVTRREFWTNPWTITVGGALLTGILGALAIHYVSPPSPDGSSTQPGGHSEPSAAASQSTASRPATFSQTLSQYVKDVLGKYDVCERSQYAHECQDPLVTSILQVQSFLTANSQQVNGFNKRFNRTVQPLLLDIKTLQDNADYKYQAATSVVMLTPEGIRLVRNMQYQFAEILQSAGGN